ncbi:MAG: hypothetical protein BIFFINMI_01402 [Phycisphaerae bacterium]|nr:hypothetical protein [Phycisphaerae bacterium]
MRWIALLLVACLPAVAAAQVRVVNPRITTDSSIDCSSVQSVLAQIIKPGMTDEQKARACWEFMLDHFYHWWPPDEADAGGNVRDFAKAINSYGFGPCFVCAPVETDLWAAAGYKTRCWTITGHTIPEIFYGDAWHMLDADGRGWHRKADGQIASVEELSKDLKLFTEPAERSAPYYPEGLPYEVHKQYEFWGPASKISDLYLSRKDNYAFNERAVYGHPMFVDLRPGETLTLNDANAGKFVKWAKYPKEKPAGPQEEVRRKTTYGNGTLVWRPDLKTISRDDLLWAGSENVKLADGRLVAVDASKPAVAVFRVFCPWVLVEAKALVTDLAGSPLKLEVSTDGGRTWGDAEAKDVASGIIAYDVNLSPRIEGRYEYLLRATLGDGTIDSLSFANTFQIAPLSLPRLKPGKNKVTVYRGPDRGVVQLVKAGKDIASPAIYVEADGLDTPKSLTPAKPDAPGHVVYKLTAPAAIKGLCVGGQFTLDYGQRPKLDAEYSLDGGRTWAAAFSIQGNRNSQNAQFERNAIIDLPGNATAEALVRFTLAGDNSFDRGKQYCGVNAIRLYAYYDLPQPPGAKLGVDLAWTETTGEKTEDKSAHWDVTRFPTDFEITCGGQAAKFKSVLFRSLKD